jgi:hypothetical protein
MAALLMEEVLVAAVAVAAVPTGSALEVQELLMVVPLAAAMLQQALMQAEEPAGQEVMAQQAHPMRMQLIARQIPPQLK